MSINIYLSPDGNDKNIGTKQAPLLSLEQAQKVVRKTLVDNLNDDIRVFLASGTYLLHKTLVMGIEDGGNSNRTVTWEAEENGQAVISSAITLKNWSKLTQEPEYIPSESKGNIWYIDLPKGSEINTIYSADGSIPRARSKAIIPLNPHGERNNDSFIFDDDSIKNWPDILEAEAVIIPEHQWTMNILPLKEVDSTKKMVYLAKPCTYKIGVPHCKKNGSIWIENSLGVIKPGSWVFHKESARLYYSPKGERPEENLQAPLSVEFIRVEGTHDLDDHQEAHGKVSGIIFKGLTFKHSRRFSFNGLTGLGIQHDWEMHDAASSMLRFRHAHHCRVEECTFTEGGSSGLRLDLACRYNIVKDCRFSNLGGVGILLCGYGLSRHYLNRDNIISGNEIHNIGLFYWHSPAVFVWQSGCNKISQNHLYNLPYTAIVCSGRSSMDRKGVGECSKTIDWDAVEAQCGKDYVHNPWHYSGITNWCMREPLLHSRENLIEYNRIHDVMQIMGDGNGIYISGGGGGNVVRFNIVGPCPSKTMSEGIRCDDDQHQTIIHGNLVYAIGGDATGITIKGVNYITNNILALPFTETCTRGMLSLETGPLNGSVIKRNVILTQNPKQAFVSEMRIHGTGRTALQRDTLSDNNLYFCIDKPNLGKDFIEKLQGFGVDIHSLGVEPGFVNPQEGDYNLNQDSPLFNLGFQALPLKKMLGVDC